MSIFSDRDEAKLVKSLKNGDLDSFNDLYYKYHKKLFYFARGYLRSKEDAEGLVQDVFIKIWEGRSKIKEGLSFNSFLFTIAYNDILKYFRKKGRERKYLDQLGVNMITDSDKESEGVEYGDLLELTHNAIEKLPEKRKHIFKLSRFEGMSNQEISDHLSISRKTVENQIYQALKFLRKQVGKETILTALFCALFIT